MVFVMEGIDEKWERRMMKEDKRRKSLKQDYNTLLLLLVPYHNSN